MRYFWFRISLSTVIAAMLAGAGWAAAHPPPALAQESTPAATPNGPLVTAGSDGVNVRSGPNYSAYPLIGYMQPGETAQALGVSPGGDWIQIAFPGGAGGVGWVYVGFVSLSPGFLRVIEPPPTPAPPATPTIDPTFAAQFNLLPTPTRLPTFTPPPPLVVPTYTDPPSDHSPFPYGGLIAGVILLGLFGLVGSSVVRR
jgi:uncharacterized protein YraI